MVKKPKGRISNIRIRKMRPNEGPTYFTQNHRWLLFLNIDGRKQIPSGFKTKKAAQSWVEWLKR